MRAFEYERPRRLDDAIALFAGLGSDARALAGGTDLIIRLRDGTLRPRVVVDVKGIDELQADMREVDGRMRFGALTTMTDIVGDERIRVHYQALTEAALFVGSVQIRNRPTPVGNMCNASPAADTAPALLVHGAEVVARGAAGVRRIALTEFFVQSGVTTLARDELVEAIEVPMADGPHGSVHLRRTRRRGHDLASVTLAVNMTPDGVTRIAYGSVGPRPVLVVDESGLLVDPSTSDQARASRIDALFSDAAPSPTSMRASPDYRLAMLRVMGLRGVAMATERLAAAAA